jgi:hypothetical protein
LRRHHAAAKRAERRVGARLFDAYHIVGVPAVMGVHGAMAGMACIIMHRYLAPRTLAHAADGVRRQRPERRLTPTRALLHAVGSHRRRCAPITHSAWAPRMVRGVSFDDYLDRDDLVVRLPQFHPLVIASARR